MANYYTHTAFQMLMPDAETAEAFHKAWDAHCEQLEDTDQDSPYADMHEFTLQHDGVMHHGLHVSDDAGTIDFDVLIDLLQEIAEDLNLSGIVVLHYAETCSSPRADAFSGGVIQVPCPGELIDAVWHSGHAWLENSNVVRIPAPPQGYNVFVLNKEKASA